MTDVLRYVPKYRNSFSCQNEINVCVDIFVLEYLKRINVHT